MNKFDNELSLISSDEVRRVTSTLVGQIPDYFWTVPASSSGKYHPEFAQGDGGLLRHTKATVKFAADLFVIFNYSKEEQDYIISALILHDSYKYGPTNEGHTKFEHPKLAAEFIRKNAPKWYSDRVAPLVETHMGQWTTSKYSDEVLKKPETNAQRFVHLCDYLASRKGIEVQFS